MNGYIENKDGYIVFDDSGICPLAYGANEKWFQTYDEAMEYALSIVKNIVGGYKERTDLNSVIVCEGSASLLQESHAFPCGRTVFCWSNYYRV